MEFTINSVEYRAAKLSVFEQLKVSRKVLPLIAKIVSDVALLKNTLKDKKPGQEEIFKTLETVLPKIADALAEMPDESVDAILHPCLKVVSRKSAMGNWTPIFSDGVLMFDDIDLFAMLGIAARVVGDNLGNFLRALPTSETVTSVDQA
ncbi:hypothetical protein CWC46_07895 [Prodigiosinella confusarubida]|uniref:Bacteriophage protein n=1 Tax=Serratia sp. (strain ATCC 39006) TaxID=104623 RepID=A0A2I5THM5_SERS3|nr:hypothetical protein [Serratia sp. ATCC 39006]AUG99750.1 hypothetical protein CWC46_07895 [Serratia sp. ATCC 39006]AUH04069.1 hypothetical protein Ser39006_007900 [Serratia sp. ATCC 39006]